MPVDAPRADLTAADLDALRRRGLDRDEIERQLALLADPPPPLELVAAATLENGIELLREGDHDALIEQWRAAAANGRVRKLVPASGAASRMFASLSRALDEAAAAEDRGEAGSLVLASVRERAQRGDATAKDVLAFASGLRDFPFRDALAAVANSAVERVEAGDADADLQPVLSALLNPEGLGFAGLAKGLIPFHRRGGRAVTPVVEHLDEAAALVRDRDGVARVHFTVPEGGEESFRRATAVATGPDVRLELELSTQSPATDTVALDASGHAFRTPDGALLFRPGGHGALLRNLSEMNGDLVLVKNIDNVQPAERSGASILWQRLLIGLLVRLQSEAFTLLDRLDDVGDDRAVPDAAAFVARWFEPRGDESGGARPLPTREELRHQLDRPLRISGMVKNTGEPGGGPFWTRDSSGRVSKQIVETAEIAAVPEQQEILRRSTHFNPVLLALALRDRRSRPYRLGDFVDPTRVFTSEKTAGGAKLRALEHPGLWNGSMAGWNTVFVEIPKEAFTPVKTVLDLLRPEHQPAASAPLKGG